MSFLLTVCPGALADHDDTQSRARELMAQGLAAEQNDDLVGAREAYQASLRAHPSFDVAGNLGLVELQLRQYPEAANHLAYCLRHFPTGEKRELKTFIEDELHRIRPFVGGVTFHVDEAGALVFVDGKAVGTAPFEHEVYIQPGHHSVELRSTDASFETTFRCRQRGRNDRAPRDPPKARKTRRTD